MMGFRNGPRDALLIPPVLVAFASQFVVAAHYDRLPWPALLVINLAILQLVASAQAAQHAHTHKPFFTWKPLNRWFHVLMSPVFSVPSSGYREGHLKHHKHTVSYEHFRLRDVLSIGSARQFAAKFLVSWLDAFMLLHAVLLVRHVWWRRGAPTPAEPLQARYETLGGYLGALVLQVVARAERDRGFARQLTIEVAAISLYRIALCALDYRYFFLVFVPFDFLSAVYSNYTEYCTHYGATRPEPGYDAVSCYSRLYNLLTGNLGYHAEHHRFPGAHWSELPAMRAAMPPEPERRVVPYCLLLNPFYPLRPARVPATPLEPPAVATRGAGG